MKPKSTRCLNCPRPSRPRSDYCTERCGERWRRKERQRIYWCAQALIDAGVLAWDREGLALVVVTRVSLDASHTLRVIDSISGRPVPTRAALPEVQNRQATRPEATRPEAHGSTLPRSTPPR